MSDLPQGWEAPRIAEILATLPDGRLVHQGKSPQCLAEAAPESGWGVLKTTAIQDGNFLAHENKWLPKTQEPDPRIEVHAGDLLLTCAGPRRRCGVPCLVRSTRPRLMLSGKMYRFRVDEAYVLPSYLESYLRSHEAQLAIDAMKTGISESGLNLTHARFSELRVPLAPIAEQRRIVDAIEAALSVLNAGVDYLEAARGRLRSLERGVRNGAVEGDGEWVPLGELIREIEAGKSFRTEGGAAVHGSWGVIKVSAMTYGEFRATENKALPSSTVIDPSWVIQEGDVLLSRANTADYVGASVRVAHTPEKLILSDKSLRLVPAEDVDARWLQLALSSPSARRQMSAVATGVKDSMRNISQVKLRTISLPRLDPEEQVRRADLTEAGLSQVSKLRETIDQEIAHAGTLRRSILAAAFSGKLVPQDPNDEPARALLERIAERAASEPPKRRRARATTGASA